MMVETAVVDQVEARPSFSTSSSIKHQSHVDTVLGDVVRGEFLNVPDNKYVNILIIVKNKYACECILNIF